MTRILLKITTFVFLLSSLCLAQQARATLVNDLQDGQHVMLMRHADAPGYGDPAGYIIGKCSTQRILGEYGRKQSKAIGVWLKVKGIGNAHVYSSPWCRCLDTANILNLGPVKIETSLGSFFDDMNLEEKQTKKMAEFIKYELAKQPRMPIILVTHHVIIQAFSGKSVGVGDMTLVKVNKNGKYLSHIIYPSPRPPQ